MSRDRIVPFNPLDKKKLAESVARALLERPAVPLGELDVFQGAGIYTVYYTGDFPAYEALAKCNRNGQFAAPIYAGRATPKGARKGSDLSAPAGQVLFNRLQQHAKSVKQARNLLLEDFFCRYLVVDDIWIPLGETLLVATHSPLWNLVVDGFGNHDPGAGRHAGIRPIWDTIHPGRTWAEKCQPREETPEEITLAIQEHLRANPPS